MSQSVKPNHDATYAARPDENSEGYQLRLAHLRAAKQFPEFDPAYVVALVAQQLETARAKGRQGPKAAI